jgi:uncharacterized protein YecE (DUF72 family)
MEAMGRILIGTSGYSYEEWVGPFYPAGMPRTRWLDHYADHFTALEINGTYYRTPAPKSAESMVRQARGRLQFSIKAPGLITHERQFGAEAVDPFRRYIDPFREAGVLGALLFQFPQSFRPEASERALIGRLAELFDGFPCVIELRRAGWEPYHPHLTELGWSIATVDQPEIDGLARSWQPASTSSIRYIRFHGRNAAMWHDGDNRSRYEYRYSRDELVAFGKRVAADGSTTTMAFFNNHANGFAAENAMALAEMLGVASQPPATPMDMFGK